MIPGKIVLVVSVALIGSACRCEENGDDRLTPKEVARKLRNLHVPLEKVEKILEQAKDRSTNHEELLGFSIGDLAAAKWNRDKRLCTYAELAKRELICKRTDTLSGYFRYCWHQITMMRETCSQDLLFKPTKRSYSKEERAAVMEVIGGVNSKRRLTPEEFQYALDFADPNDVPAIISRKPKPSRIFWHEAKHERIARAVEAMAWRNDTSQCSLDKYERIKNACDVVFGWCHEYKGAFEYCERQLEAMGKQCKDNQRIMDDCLKSIEDGKELKKFVEEGSKNYKPELSRDDLKKVEKACLRLFAKIENARDLFNEKFIEDQLVVNLCTHITKMRPKSFPTLTKDVV
jgi:hypothetical protein